MGGSMKEDLRHLGDPPLPHMTGVRVVVTADLFPCVPFSDMRHDHLLETPNHAAHEFSSAFAHEGM